MGTKLQELCLPHPNTCVHKAKIRVKFGSASKCGQNFLC